MLQIVRHLSVAEAFQAMRSQPGGLSEPEARHRLAEYGPNRLQEAPGVAWWLRLSRQFAHLMALLLWASAALAWIAGMPQLAWAIVAVNLINGSFSYWQEYQAERATAELRRMLPYRVKVQREGAVRELEAPELVPGDLFLLAEGDQIAADARVIQESALRVDQSSLTGECLPVAKTADPVTPDHLGTLDAANMVFAGSVVVAGTALALTCATGMTTEFGKIARLTAAVEDESSPLEREIRRTTRGVTYLAVGCGLLCLLMAHQMAGMTWTRAVPFSLGMVVAFVPEGLAPTLTLALALAVRRMARRQAIVKRLSAVETLGSATVICTDKTGTLTQNQMTVVACWDGQSESQVSGRGYLPQGHINGPAPSEELLRAAALCNDAHLNQDKCVGDSTEGALLTLCAKASFDYQTCRSQFPRVDVLAFDSRRKRMTTVHGRNGSWAAYTKGAPSQVLPLCRSALRGVWDPAGIRCQEDIYARQGLRVLALARRLGTSAEIPAAAELETGLEFLGLIAMCDPPRAEVPQAMQSCRRAGIRVIMITGDHGVTAQAVAEAAGLVSHDEIKVILGEQVERLTEQELVEALSRPVLFARATPEHKLRVVAALQSLGEVVAVTGDGVNDAPALKRADIGVAMGVSGSDVAREAADMVLADDSFASIVAAIEEGRGVYGNIRNFISYIFTSNTAEALPLVVFALSGGTLPLALPVMLVLAIDLGTDLLPALALGAEAPSGHLMDHSPRSKSEHLLTWGLLLRSLVYLGLLEGALTMGGFLQEYAARGIHQAWFQAPDSVYRSACTAALGATIAAQIGNLLTHRPVGAKANPLIGWGILAEILFFLTLCYVPWMQQAFGTAPISPGTWLYLLGCMPCLWLWDRVRRIFEGNK